MDSSILQKEKDKWEINYLSSRVDGHKMLFYGTSENMYNNGRGNLNRVTRRGELYKEHNIYFVESIAYEASDEGVFQLMVYHYEDDIMSIDTYRVGPDDGKVFLELLDKGEWFKRRFGRIRGEEAFVNYCYENKIWVDHAHWVNW